MKIDRCDLDGRLRTSTLLLSALLPFSPSSTTVAVAFNAQRAKNPRVGQTSPTSLVLVLGSVRRGKYGLLLAAGRKPGNRSQMQGEKLKDGKMFGGKPLTTVLTRGIVRFVNKTEKEEERDAKTRTRHWVWIWNDF